VINREFNATRIAWAAAQALGSAEGPGEIVHDTPQQLAALGGSACEQGQQEVAARIGVAAFRVARNQGLLAFSAQWAP
jgi:hypothetical protein